MWQHTARHSITLTLRQSCGKHLQPFLAYFKVRQSLQQEHGFSVNSHSTSPSLMNREPAVPAFRPGFGATSLPGQRLTRSPRRRGGHTALLGAGTAHRRRRAALGNPGRRGADRCGRSLGKASPGRCNTPPPPRARRSGAGTHRQGVIDVEGDLPLLEGELLLPVPADRHQPRHLRRVPALQPASRERPEVNARRAPPAHFHHQQGASLRSTSPDSPRAAPGPPLPHGAGGARKAAGRARGARGNARAGRAAARSGRKRRADPGPPPARRHRPDPRRLRPPPALPAGRAGGAGEPRGPQPGGPTRGPAPPGPARPAARRRRRGGSPEPPALRPSRSPQPRRGPRRPAPPTPGLYRRSASPRPGRCDRRADTSGSATEPPPSSPPPRALPAAAGPAPPPSREISPLPASPHPRAAPGPAEAAGGAAPSVTRGGSAATPRYKRPRTAALLPAPPEVRPGAAGERIAGRRA